MNFIFTVALNNTISANQFKTITNLFKSLALTLEELGHNTYIVCNPNSIITVNNAYEKVFLTETLTSENYDEVIQAVGFVPDYAFIWNGNVITDSSVINLLESNGIKIIYGELGFFKHFERTCYFDLNGVNCKVGDVAQPLSENITDEDRDIINKLQEENIQPRLVGEPFIFVPLQIETDTQIVKYSPFKTMNEFMIHVGEVFKHDSRKILFKQHPLRKISVDITLDKFEEVFDDVHHYLPYADVVVGINSTVLVETLMYHNRIIGFGAGITSRQISDLQRQKLVANLQRKQIKWDDLKDKDKVANLQFYRDIIEDFSK